MQQILSAASRCRPRTQAELRAGNVIIEFQNLTRDSTREAGLELSASSRHDPDALDALLQRFATAQTDAEVESSLSRILQDFARPLISRIVGSALRGPAARDFDDLVSETLMHLVRRFREMRDDGTAIHDARGYIATATYNRCREYLRQRSPSRNRLRNQLRYLLNHHSEFTTWQTPEGRILCGRVSVRDRAPMPGDWLQNLALPALPDPVAHNRVQLIALVEQILRRATAPVETDGLIQAVARLIGIEEPATDLPLSSVDVRSASEVEMQVEMRLSLRQLWDDVRQLPPRQRTALLLGLRDSQGREILSLLPQTRTTTIAGIAEALEIPIDRLAELWSSLPLDDVSIGDILGATRQQVIKLRRLARERLRRSAARREQSVAPPSRRNVVPKSPSTDRDLRLNL